MSYFTFKNGIQIAWSKHRVTSTCDINLCVGDSSTSSSVISSSEILDKLSGYHLRLRKTIFIGQKAKKSLRLFPFSKTMQWVRLCLSPQIDYYVFVFSVTLLHWNYNLGQYKWNIWTTPPPISMMPKWRVLLLCTFTIASGGWRFIVPTYFVQDFSLVSTEANVRILNLVPAPLGRDPGNEVVRESF